MKSQFFFWVGCIAGIGIGSMAAWLIISDKRESGDFVRLYPQEIQHFMDDCPATQWLRSAEGRRIGLFDVMTPRNKQNASLLVCSARKGHAYPQVWMVSTNNNEDVESIMILGKGLTAGVFVESDINGKITGIGLSSNIGKTNWVTRYDKNLDGEYDARLGPGRTMSANVDHQWYDLIHTNKKQYVEINGILTHVKSIDGVWRIMKEE